MAFDIELKEDSPEKLVAIAGKPTKYYLSASELMALVDYVNGLDLDQILNVGNSSTMGIEVAGLTLSGKINFITSLITALRNVTFPDKSGTVAYLDDIILQSQNIASKQSAELLLTFSDVVQYGGMPRIPSLTIQGHTLVQGSRVVVTGYNIPFFNGIYRVVSGPFIGTGEYSLNRTSDANTGLALNNAIVSITNGTFAGKTYIQTTANPIINTTAINFVEFGGIAASATNLVAGIMKLYTSIGINEDGTMTQKAITDALALKQNTLVSATNIKTINGNSVLGSGDLPIGGSNTQVKIQNTDITTTSNIQIDTGINFVLEANSTYAIEGYFYGGCLSTGGMKFGWRDLPVGVNGIQSVLAFLGLTNNSGNAGAVWAIGAVIPAFAGGGGFQQIRYAATITTGATGGTITAQFSSNSNGQTSVFRALSRITIIKL